jgi:hypothetical protein
MLDHSRLSGEMQASPPAYKQASTHRSLDTNSELLLPVTRIRADGKGTPVAVLLLIGGRARR